MFARMAMVLAAVVVVAAGLVATSSGIASAEAPEKVVTLNPTSGVVGTVVTAELFNAPPNDPITVIFKIPGDPILTTGTTDANGYAKFTFTIPYVPGGGTWPVFFTDFKCSCQIATDFTVINSRPTPTNTPTPTAIPSATPTRTPTLPATATSTPTPTNTPAVPTLGGGPVSPGGGPNAGILALGMLAVVAVLAWFTATRRGTPPIAAALTIVEHEPDYSTELDLPTLASLRMDPPPAVSIRRNRAALAWGIGASVSAAVGLLLLKRR